MGGDLGVSGRENLGFLGGKRKEAHCGGKFGVSRGENVAFCGRTAHKSAQVRWRNLGFTGRATCESVHVRWGEIWGSQCARRAKAPKRDRRNRPSALGEGGGVGVIWDPEARGVRSAQVQREFFEVPRGRESAQVQG